MEVLRKIKTEVTKENGFQVGDQIKIGKYYTATCQKIGKKGAIFMMDQYLYNTMAMNVNRTNNEGGYTKSDVRQFLHGMHLNSMFDEIRDLLVPFKNGDMLRIPTAEEMFGPEEAHKYYEALNNKKQWPLMKDRRNRIASREEWGWLQNKYKVSAAAFACVGNSGGVNYNHASCVLGVRVVFKLSLNLICKGGDESDEDSE